MPPDTIALPVPAAGGSVLRVGAGEAFATLSAALSAARDGDVVLVDAGTYTDDFATVRAQVSIVGVGGMVNLVATTSPPDGKSILTVDATCSIANLTFSGCKVPDANGAGIRYEGGNLSLTNCGFYGNENGLMSAAVPGGQLVINHCDFSGNGNGSGYTHNLYVGAIASAVITNSRFSDAVVGHEIKSRALSTTITGCTIADGPTGTASYSIDLPNGGKAVIEGNTIEKGPLAQNWAAIHYGGEGIPYAGSGLLVQGNTLNNDLGPQAVAVLNQTAVSVTVTGNSLGSFDPSRIVQGPGKVTGNTDGSGAALPDATLVGVLPGATQVFTDSDPHQVTLGSSNTAVQGGAGRLGVYAQAGHIVAIGGAGGMDYAESATSGGNQVTTAAGSVNTVVLNGQDSIDSEGTDTITGGGGNITGQVGGQAMILDGSGDNHWSIEGSARLTGGGGAAFLNVGAGADAAMDGTFRFLGLTSNGGSIAYDATIGGTKVQADFSGGAFSGYVGGDGRVSISTAGGSEGVEMHLGSGNGQVVSGGADTIWAGSGALTVQAWGAASIHAGTGALAVYSRGWSGASLYGNGGSYVIGGDTGGVTYYGGDKDSTVEAQLSHVTLIGGAGRMTVVAGYNETIIGGAGGLVVTAAAQSGGGSISTAAGSTNSLAANNQAVDSWGTDTITESGGGSDVTVHGSATVLGGENDNTATILGRATLIGRGHDRVVLAAGADATIGAGRLLDLSETGATLHLSVPGLADAAGASLGAPAPAPLTTATVTGGAASVWVDEGRAVQISTGNAGTSVSVDGGSSTIRTGGADQVHTGAGTATVQITAANTSLWAGSGHTEVQDWDWTAGDAQTIHGGDGTLHVGDNYSRISFTGGSGAATFEGAGAGLVLQGGSGDITLNNAGGRGVANFVGGAGNARLQLTPGGGAVVFGGGNAAVLEAGWGDAVTYTATAASTGAQTITGFRPGVDMLHLQDVTITGQATAADGDGTPVTTLSLNTGGTIGFRGWAGPITAVTDAAPPGLVLNVSEDAWQGDAQFTVSVDGQQVGGVLTATALHGAGQTEAVRLCDALSTDRAHIVAVSFLNDAYGGSPDTDRNLYVDSITNNGAAVPGGVGMLYREGTQGFLVAPDAQASASGLTLNVSEDAWQGDAQLAIAVDGQQVGVLTATALHGMGQTQAIALGNVLAGANPHTIAVSFLNDAWGGTADTDRNLYVDSITMGGVAVPGGSAVFHCNGTQQFLVPAPAG